MYIYYIYYIFITYNIYIIYKNTSADVETQR